MVEGVKRNRERIVTMMMWSTSTVVIGSRPHKAAREVWCGYHERRVVLCSTREKQRGEGVAAQPSRG